jgi:bacterioferritin
MQGDPLVIGLLQAQLKNELTAINQYFVHYRMFKHWGFERMAKKEYEESIGEMKHADALIERLLMLDALANLQDLGKLLIGETLIEALGCDLQSERGAQATLKDGIAQAETARDFVSRALFEHISMTPRSTSTSSKRSSTSSARSASTTICNRSSAPEPIRPLAGSAAGCHGVFLAGLQM